MKEILITLTIIISFYSLNAQNHFYGSYNNLIENQQKGILKRERVKTIIIGNHQYPYKARRHVSDKFITIDTLGNIQKIISQSSDKKSTNYYIYNELNKLEQKKTKIEKGDFRTRKSKGSFMYSRPLATLINASNGFSPDEFYYLYDNEKRLIKKKSCKDTKCKIEQTKYVDGKVFTYYHDVDGNLEQSKIWRMKDSLEIEIRLNEFNEIENKSVTIFDKNSLKLYKENYKRDTLTYREINEIDDNNRIVKSIKSNYYKKYNSNEMKQSTREENYIYNKDFSFRTILRKSDNTNIWRYEYHYNEKGLLTAINVFIDERLSYSKFYEYNMW